MIVLPASRLLPKGEGLQLAVDALDGYTGSPLIERFEALQWFRSSLVLDWIERRLPSMGIVELFGQIILGKAVSRHL